MTWKQIASLSTTDLLRWAEDRSWARAMHQCSQDQAWHSEGDVWTHTIRVCRELEDVEGWNELSIRDQVTLRFAAMFHDCAKPLTTRMDTTSGRLRSPRHAVKGEALARQLLREWECPYDLRERICGLVRYHGKPVHLPSETKPEFELARLSWLTNHRLLFMLAMADLRGRESAETNRSEDDLLWYRELATDHACLDRPRELANDEARFLLGRRRLSDLHYVPYEDYRCDVTLMCGLPGSGKDTWLAKYRPETPVISLDRIRVQMGIQPDDNQGTVVQRASELCRRRLRSGDPFALNATNTTSSVRTKWIDLFVGYSARVAVVSIENTLEETFQQNDQRDDPVPESVIARLSKRSQPVTSLEAHRVDYIISQRLRESGNE